MSFRDEVIWELYPETHSISDEPVGVLDKNNNKIKLDESDWRKPGENNSGQLVVLIVLRIK